MISTSEILTTIEMIREQKLDIRTITMGLSLLECIGGNTPQKVYDLVTAPVFRWLGKKLSRLDELLSIQ